MRLFKMDQTAVVAAGVVGFASQCVLALNSTNATNTANNENSAVGYGLLGLVPVIFVVAGFGVAIIREYCCKIKPPEVSLESGAYSIN